MLILFYPIMKKTIGIVLVSLFISVLRSEAQFGIGAQLSSVSWMDNKSYVVGQATDIYSPGSGNGFGIQGYYIIKPKIRVCLSLDYVYPPAETTRTDYVIQGQSYSSTTNVSTPAVILRGDAHYAIAHDFLKNGFCLYALGGFVLNLYDYKVNFANYSVSQNGYYTLIGFSSQSHSYTSPSFNLGFGLEYAFNQKFRVFFDVRGCSGAQTNLNPPNLSAPTLDFLPINFNPGYFVVSLGLRINLVSPWEPAPQKTPVK